jgi:uncharacterized membrane protein
VIGVALCLLHPALSAGLAASGTPVWASVILVDANRTLEIGDATRLIVSYPILPWFGVMAAGYGLGELILRRPAEWAAQVARLGVDPEPWRADLPAWRSAMPLLNARSTRRRRCS